MMPWHHERCRVHWIGVNLVCVLWLLACFWEEPHWRYVLPLPLNLWVIGWLWWYKPR
jgi:hypothetical protein